MILKKPISGQDTVQSVLNDLTTDYGLTRPMLAQIWQMPENRSFLRHSQPPAPSTLLSGAPYLHVPLQATIHNRFTPVTDPTGLRPVLVGSNAAPICTHGLRMEITRNLKFGRKIAWIQTVKRENDPLSAPRQSIEFVDAGINNTPFSSRDPHNRVLYEDTPCGLVAASGPQLKWTGTTTLVIRLQQSGMTDMIFLLAGLVWGFEIVAGSVQPMTPQPATQQQIAHQLTVLRNGTNQYGQATGQHFHYIDASAPGYRLQVP